MMAANDHFSGSAVAYRSYRPGYPGALFEFLAELAPARRRAWDCAAGSAQAASALTRYFEHVVATDLSLEQLREAPADGIDRVATLAERSCLAPGSCDLVTVAQALHWLDVDAFYAEVARVARPGAVLAAWTYGLCRVSAAVDAVVDDFHGPAGVGHYWPPERRHVNAGYRTLPFPFEETEAPALEMAMPMTGHAFLGYLGTWSAVQRARAALGEDPLAAVRARLAESWGPLGMAREVHWPLCLRVGRLGSAE